MAERQRTVLVDMDNVMADFDGAALVNVPRDLIVPRSKFYVAQDYPEHLRSGIKSVYNAPRFFEGLEVVDGLHKGWQAMLDSGYSPRVASAPLDSNKGSIEGKIKWLDRVMVPSFGAGVVEDAIFDKDKWRYSALAIIDDNPVISKGVDDSMSADWEHILFGWSHLTAVPMATAAFRLMGWQDTDNLIRMLDIISLSRR